MAEEISSENVSGLENQQDKLENREDLEFQREQALDELVNMRDGGTVENLINLLSDNSKTDWATSEDFKGIRQAAKNLRLLGNPKDFKNVSDVGGL